MVCAGVQTGRADAFSAEDLFDTNNVLSTAVGYFETVNGWKLPGPIGHVMTGLSVLGSGGDVADLLGVDTGGRRIVGGLGVGSLILDLADLAKLPTNPLGLALGVAGSFIEATIPLGERDCDEVLDMGSHHLFGRDAEDLTTAQRDMLSRRYEGRWVGVCIVRVSAGAIRRGTRKRPPSSTRSVPCSPQARRSPWSTSDRGAACSTSPQQNATSRWRSSTVARSSHCAPAR